MPSRRSRGRKGMHSSGREQPGTSGTATVPTDTTVQATCRYECGLTEDRDGSDRSRNKDEEHGMGKRRAGKRQGSGRHATAKLYAPYGMHMNFALTRRCTGRSCAPAACPWPPGGGIPVTRAPDGSRTAPSGAVLRQNAMLERNSGTNTGPVRRRPPRVPDLVPLFVQMRASARGCRLRAVESGR